MNFDRWEILPLSLLALAFLIATASILTFAVAVIYHIFDPGCPTVVCW